MREEQEATASQIAELERKRDELLALPEQPEVAEDDPMDAERQAKKARLMRLEDQPVLPPDDAIVKQDDKTLSDWSAKLEYELMEYESALQEAEKRAKEEALANMWV